jgi:hypothetical protein
MCQNWFTIVRGWVMCQIQSCVKTGSRLFVVGFMCQNWFTIVRGWFMCQNWFTIVRGWFMCQNLIDLFVVQKHSSGDFNTKTLKKMRLVPFYVYIYTVCRLLCVLYTR